MVADDSEVLEKLARRGVAGNAGCRDLKPSPREKSSGVLVRWYDVSGCNALLRSPPRTLPIASTHEDDMLIPKLALSLLSAFSVSSV